MFRFLLIALLVALTSAFMAPIARVSQSSMIVMNGGKGFGGGEATRVSGALLAKAYPWLTRFH